MADYPFGDIEKKWQEYWQRENTYKTDETSGKPPYYILDMFPYPSGAGLHVGHPLGYIASDIIARFKRHKQFEVLHPMGFDAFGLPAEQFAIDTGNHPGDFTDKNIERYRQQLRMIGLSYDWSREVKTSDPKFYKWTQWIFIQLFNSWYNTETDKAEDIDSLIKIFEKEGNANVKAHCMPTITFSAADWNSRTEPEQQKMLLNYRLAYIAESEVNWCEALGTVLANEEVKDGFSERGGYPVVKKKMRQWFMRITAYADKLLQGLNEIEWPEAVKEMQRNWIGKSVGAEVEFPLEHHKSIRIFTTRPDTIFGCSFMVLAPEHPLVNEITTKDNREDVNAHVEAAKRKSDRERMAEVKKISGVFTGAYAINPFSEDKIPVWIADYVLGDYGTGAIMAVPAHDSRDWAFAMHFSIPVFEVVAGGNVMESSYDAKDGILMNSGFLDGLHVQEAIEEAIKEIEKRGIGKKQVNYRLRDANFSRQRYWGEPFPVYFKGDIPHMIDEKDLPVRLPEVESYKPLGTGESPLAALEVWVNLPNGGKRETNTMPGWAGSSWYYLRYMDPFNDKEFVSKEREEYWKHVDFYIGGAEHATGHLLYSRFWNRFLYDKGLVSTKEPFKKMINQGMIQGKSSIAYKLNIDYLIEIDLYNDKTPLIFVSKNIAERIIKEGLTESEKELLKDKYIDLNGYSAFPHFVGFSSVHVDISIVIDDKLDIESFKFWRDEYKDADFILEEGKYICGSEVEKMSKSKYNVITPDGIIEKYGCDTFRMYEMFLGPVEQSKPWDTKGIEGVSRFLRKFWGLFFAKDSDVLLVSEETATPEELKILHRAIKKVTEDIERFNLNTCISSFMICVNELAALKCNKRAVLEPLLILISPFAPHISEELWSKLGSTTSIAREPYPIFDEKYLVESSFEYPVSINGKMRTKIELPLDMPKEEVEKQIHALDLSKWTEGKPLKKVIVVPGKIVNVVV